MDANSLLVLYRDLLDDLTDELIVELRVARAALHDAVPHLLMAGGLFLQADFHLLGVQDLCFEGFFLVRQGLHFGIQFGIAHVLQQPVQQIALLPTHRFQVFLQFQQLCASLR